MTRLVDVEGRRQGVMTVREQVAAFLRTQTTLCLCDECLGACSQHSRRIGTSGSGATVQLGRLPASMSVLFTVCERQAHHGCVAASVTAHSRLRLPRQAG